MSVSLGGAEVKGGVPAKACSLQQRPIKGKPSKAENFLIITVLFLSNTTGKNKASLPSCQQSQVESLDLYISTSIMRHPNTPIRIVSEKAR